VRRSSLGKSSPSVPDRRLGLERVVNIRFRAFAEISGLGDSLYAPQTVIGIPSVCSYDGDVCVGIDPSHGVDLLSLDVLVVLDDTEGVHPKKRDVQQLEQLDRMPDGERQGDVGRRQGSRLKETGQVCRGRLRDAGAAPDVAERRILVIRAGWREALPLNVDEPLRSCFHRIMG
jgi:hypothetical protein